MLLAIDTSTSAVTAALCGETGVGGETGAIARTTTIDSRRHTEILAPAIAAMLKDAGVVPADLTRVVVGVGPGPFTGLRVGIVTGLTFGAALGIDVDGVCSLDAVAQQAAQTGVRGPILVATDARRKEVYWAEYELTDQLIRPGEPGVDKPAVVAAIVGDLPTYGRGGILYPDVLRDATQGSETLLDVDAGALGTLALDRLAQGEKLLAPEPLYLRRPDAQPQAPVHIARALGR